MKGGCMGRSISLIMPAFNEGNHIESAVRTVLKKLQARYFDYEIIIFDDASTDDTGKIADKFALEDTRVKVVHNQVNMNLGFNFAKGIQLASKANIGLWPCHDLIASESFDSILPALGEKDVVVAYIANPMIRPFGRRAGSQFVMALLNLLFGFKLKYYHLNFYRADLLKKLIVYTKSNAYALMGELLILSLSSGASYTEVPFFRKERLVGKSNAMRFRNIIGFLDTYSRLFWQIRVLRKKINLN